MIRPILSPRYLARYGKGDDNPEGTPPDPYRCCVEVHPNDERNNRQCHYRRGYGPDRAYCRYHFTSLQRYRASKGET